MALLLLAAIGVLVAVAAGAAAVVWAVRAQSRSRGLSNQVVPGTPTRAPASWAGSHDPEARLHRRLRDAVAALRNATGIHTDTAALELRVELEQHALALDDALVDAAGLPAQARTEPLAHIEAGVDRLEAAVAEMATRTAADAYRRIEGVAADARSRHELLAAARLEIDRASHAGASPTGSTPAAPRQAPAAPAATEPPAPQPQAGTQPGSATEPPTGQPAPQTDPPGRTQPPTPPS